MGQNIAGDYVNVTVNENEGLNVSLNSPLTAFGEVQTSTNTAFVQATGVYNFIPSNFRSYTSSGGSTSSSHYDP
jgi:hypothetical protein